MEHLNSVTLRGFVGNVRIMDVQDRKVANFSVATNYAFKNSNGEAVIETTWHNVTAWSGCKSADITAIRKGIAVEVEGRIRANRYTGSDGESRVIYEVLARDVKILDTQPACENGQ